LQHAIDTGGYPQVRHHLFSEFEEVLQLFIISAACIGAILSSVFSLTHGITDVFPFLYILPIILVVYFYPKQALIFTLCISLMYISLVFLLAAGNTDLMVIAAAWFAIFMTIGAVASFYATRLLEEQRRIRNIINNSQDGIFCFSLVNGSLIEVNAKFAQLLGYDCTDLVGRDIAQIWTDMDERERFYALVKTERKTIETEIVLRARNGTVLRFTISPLEITRDRVLCSAVEITGSRITDDEIQKTLDALEEQVRARTAHLERINENLKAEILEYRRFENAFLEERKINPDTHEGQK